MNSQGSLAGTVIIGHLSAESARLRMLTLNGLVLSQGAVPTTPRIGVALEVRHQGALFLRSSFRSNIELTGVESYCSLSNAVGALSFGAKDKSP